MEVETKEFKINPWDYILTIEGSLLLSGAVVRRNPTADRSQYTTPFTVRFSPLGFSSSAWEENGRYESWFPLWNRPASYSEIKYLFSEGRSIVGRRVARTGIEFSRAVGTLGVDRGIDTFERYAFVQRRGKSMAALPVGRFDVRYKPELELLEELDPITQEVDRFLRGFKDPPATFKSAKRVVDEAVFECTRHVEPFAFNALVRSLGRLERLFARRDRHLNPNLFRPLSGLSPRWISLCDDGGVEVRIAAALASIKNTEDVGPLRANMTPLNPAKPWRWAEGKGQCHWVGSSLPERLAGVLRRRMMDAERTSAPRAPIDARIRLSPYDVQSFLTGDCDDMKIEELLWGFCLIDWRRRGVQTLLQQWKYPLSKYPLSRNWCLLKLLHLPERIRDVKIKNEQRIVQLLAAGRTGEASNTAIHRLKVSRLHPFDATYREEIDPVRLSAGLLVPVREIWRLEELVLEKQSKSEG